MRQSQDVRITYFKVRCADGADYTDALYANGHHQVEVVVEVLKEVRGKSGGWDSVALSESERASINIVPVLGEFDGDDAAGWMCDTEKNEYDLGCWKRTGGEVGESVPKSVVLDPRIESVKRYMRLKENASLEPTRLMATIVLDDGSVENSYSEYPMSFQSVVLVEPVAPPVLDSSEMEWINDDNAFNGGGVDVDLYWGVPRNGLRFVHNYGLVEPMVVQDEGVNFHTSYGFSNRYKGGVFKEFPSGELRLNMIHQYLPISGEDQNPVIRRQSNSIMCAVRLNATISELPQEDIQSKWMLQDNYGNLHAFKVVPYEGGNRLTVEPVKLRRKPSIFQITLDSGQNSTSELYANGVHQCKLVIEVRVEREGADNKWEPVALTPEEKESATITLYSKNENQQLPVGWSCDKEKNVYDLGVWQRGLNAMEIEQEINGESTNLRASPFTETIERYLRFSSSPPIESHRFMATIVIGGKKYTTNFVDAEVNFDSYVLVTPVRPHVLRVADLTRYWDEGSYWNSRTQTDVDVYRWVPPKGLRFLINKGLDRPLYFAYEGDRMQSAWCNRRRNNNIWSKGGVLMINNSPGEKVRLKDLHKVMPELSQGQNPEVRFDYSISPMCAARIAISVFLGDSDSQSPWRVVDNFGCEHAFILASGPDGHELLLRDY
ncbi:hypothetical protein [Pseudomonas shahriarae]|uniref:hypothetical protein n=1 Tax=Pseudomonas shahriarae TaxID=2745512 RepID=UPI00235E6B6D|nr:hypothetical protein [Pseudomonas shahriarae]MDD0979969.1 hypothetical protein [Pseudomonas shahriarae]